MGGEKTRRESVCPGIARNTSCNPREWSSSSPSPPPCPRSPKGEWPNTGRLGHGRLRFDQKERERHVGEGRRSTQGEATEQFGRDG